MLRLAAPLAIVSAALAMAAGCGGDGGGGGGQTGGADVAPATAALFLALNTDFEGDQWQTAVDLVDRFPAGREALDTFRQDLEEQEDVDFEQDVRPALGPEVALVLLGFEDEDAVLMTQPEDEEKLQALVEKSEGAVAEEIDGWWVVAESQEILDRFKDARGDDSLADTEAFDRTTGALPDETLATLYVNGEQLTPLLEASGTSEEEMAALECSLGDAGIPSMAFSLGAEDDGARLSGAIRAQNLAVPEEGGAELAGEVAGGALVFASFRGLGDQLRGTLRCLREADEEFNEQLGQAELFLGVSVEEDILPLFEEETAIVVYPPSEDAAAEATELPFEIPTAALVTQVEDEAEALETADELAEQAASLADGAEVEELDIGGVEARRVETGEVDVYYAAFDGKLVVATNEEGIEAAQGEGESLSDDEDYAGAREAAGPPDETTGFWYADLADGVDYVLDIYGETEGEDVPAEVEESLEPLRSLFLWTETEGDDVYSFEGFLEIE